MPCVKTILREMGEEINSKVKDVNCGGCGIVAAEIAKNLPSYYRPTIRMYSRITDLIAYFEHNPHLKQQRDVDYWPRFNIGHAVVQITVGKRKYLVDTNDVRPLDDPYSRLYLGYYKLAKGSFPLDTLELLNDHADNWNKMFNRQHIPTINEIVKKHLQVLY